MVDAIVHPVAGDDEIGLGELEGAVQAFVDIGAREWVGGFGESGHSFGPQTNGDDFRDMALKVKGSLEVGDVGPVGSDGVSENENTIGCKDGVLGFPNSPNVLEDMIDFGIVLQEIGAIEGVEIILGEVGFRGFGEVFHLVGHRVGFAFVDEDNGAIGLGGSLGNILIGAGFPGFSIGAANGLVAVSLDVVVECVGEFVEGEIGHAPRLEFKVFDVGELDCFGHFDGLAVGSQPVGAGVVAGPALSIWRGREVEGDFLQVGKGGSGNALVKILKLEVEELEGAITVANEVLVNEDGPPLAIEAGVSGGRGEVGMTGGSQIGSEGIPIRNKLVAFRN